MMFGQAIHDETSSRLIWLDLQLVVIALNLQVENLSALMSRTRMGVAPSQVVVIKCGRAAVLVQKSPLFIASMRRCKVRVPLTYTQRRTLPYHRWTVS
jgi:hypothetical protein